MNSPLFLSLLFIMVASFASIVHGNLPKTEEVHVQKAKPIGKPAAHFNHIPEISSKPATETAAAETNHHNKNSEKPEAAAAGGADLHRNNKDNHNENKKTEADNGNGAAVAKSHKEGENAPHPAAGHGQQQNHPAEPSSPRNAPNKPASSGNVQQKVDIFKKDQNEHTAAGNAKATRPRMTFSQLRAPPSLKHSALPAINENAAEINPVFARAAGVRNAADLGYDLDKTDALLHKTRDELGATNSYAQGLNSKIDTNKVENETAQNTLKEYTGELFRSITESQDNLRGLDEDYRKTADSHSTLNTNFENHLTANTKAHNDIKTKFENAEGKIGTLRTDLDKETDRLNNVFTGHEELRGKHNTLSEKVEGEQVIGEIKNLGTKLTDHGTELVRLKGEDKRLDGEIKKTNDQHETFKKETFEPHVAETKGEFKRVDQRMGVFDAQAKKFGDEQTAHGQRIEGLDQDLNAQKLSGANHLKRIKLRKNEMLAIRGKVLKVPELLQSLFTNENAIVNHIVDLEKELPQILFNGQKSVNEANRELLKANQEAAKAEHENQQKILTANEKLVQANEKLNENIEKFVEKFQQTRSNLISVLQYKQINLIDSQIEADKNEEKKRQTDSAFRKEDKKRRAAEAAVSNVEREEDEGENGGSGLAGLDEAVEEDATVPPPYAAAASIGEGENESELFGQEKESNLPPTLDEE